MRNRPIFRPMAPDGLEVRLALSHAGAAMKSEHVNVEVMTAKSVAYEFRSAAAEAKFEQMHPQFQRNHPDILLLNDGENGLGTLHFDHIIWGKTSAPSGT